MFDVTKIQDGLEGLVGVRQPSNPAYATVDANNLLSSSGRYLDDLPNFKWQYFTDTQDYASISDADLNDLFRQIKRAAIVSVCQSVFGDDNYIDRSPLYSYAMNRITPESTLTNGFIGFKIEPSMTKSIAFKISRVRLEFSGTGTIKLILFNSNLDTPLFTKDVTITQNSQVETLDWVVNNSDLDYKGEYYFGYIYDGTLIPYKRDYERSNIINDLKELCIEKVYVTGANDANIFDLSDVYGLSENTGLNPDITVYNDYTDQILQNANLFAHAIQIQTAINIMNRYVYSSRSNRNERLSKDVIMILQAIEGTPTDAPVNVTGLKQVLGKEIIELRKVLIDLKFGYFGGKIQTGTLL